MNHSTPQRLRSLDILRGITIAGMILVNNPGSWASIYAPLAHASWNGLTPTDLVFPFFLFIMGISAYISLRKYDFTYSNAVARKIIKRTTLIFAIGLAIAWFSLFCRTWNALSADDLPFWERLLRSSITFDRLRILGVMQRLALTYGITALIALCLPHRLIPSLIALLLTAYALLLWLGNGFIYGESNILSIVDRALLGIHHIYNDKGIEPEGILSTIPAVAHVLIGFYTGKKLMETDRIDKKIQQLFITGTLLTILGFLWSYGCPLNKKVWSPSFVLTSCGFASSLLALLIWAIDVKGYRPTARFFESFGVNPLFTYVLAAFLAILTANIRIPIAGSATSLHGIAYHHFLQPLLGPYPASLAYALLFLTLIWAIAHILYRKKIYIKI
jgi:predicted acyltransferase